MQTHSSWGTGTRLVSILCRHRRLSTRLSAHPYHSIYLASPPLPPPTPPLLSTWPPSHLRAVCVNPHWANRDTCACQCPFVLAVCHEGSQLGRTASRGCATGSTAHARSACGALSSREHRVAGASSASERQPTVHRACPLLLEVRHRKPQGSLHE